MLKNFVGSTSYENISTRKFYNIEVGKNVRRVTTMEKFFERNCIRGYHVYKKVLTTTIGEALVCEREPKTLPIDTLWL